jgi:hypothetical protein
VFVVIHDEHDLLFHDHCDALVCAERVNVSAARLISVKVTVQDGTALWIDDGPGPDARQSLPAQPFLDGLDDPDMI